jgi:ABC-type nitrate/sulfonate/bicarbonate transport system permease component
MRVGMGLSFTTVVAAEMLAADAGLPTSSSTPGSGSRPT